MTDASDELMVRFRRGVAEDAARSAVEKAGGKVRRRMKSDHADEVTLLVKLEPRELERAESELGRHPDVAATERNSGGYRPM